MNLASISVFFGAAAISFAVSLGVLWPSRTHADDQETAAANADDIGVDTTVIGKVEANSRIIRDPQGKGKWILEVACKNTGNAKEHVDIEEQVLKSVYQPMMARGGPVPTLAFKIKDKVDVPAGETTVVRHPLPGWLNVQVNNAIRAPKVDRKGNPVMAPSTSFTTSVVKA